MTARKPKQHVRPQVDELARSADAETFRGRTGWPRERIEFLRSAIGTHANGPRLVVVAVAAALLWANLAGDSYTALWRAELRVGVGDQLYGLSLREIVNECLMTIFFLVVGLEARREFDLGDLRDRRRSVLPLAIGAAGLAVPGLMFAVINLAAPAGNPHAWGLAISSDTAMALGALTLLDPGADPRVRQFLVTVLVADDIGALAVIAVVYSGTVRLLGLCLAVVAFVVFYCARRLGAPRAILVLSAISAWLALRAGGIDPIVSGLVLGLLTPAYSPALHQLEHATRGVRAFREQPSALAARAAISRLQAATSPNARLQQRFGAGVSLVVLPMFVLANLGIGLSGPLMTRALSSPISWGILAGLLLGKPAAYIGISWAARLITRGPSMLPVAWRDVVTAGSISSMGFAVTLLIAPKALHGSQVDEAALGAMASLLLGPVLAMGWARLVRSLPSRLASRLIEPSAPFLLDLVTPVDVGRDHVRGQTDAPVTIVEYGDFECPFCVVAERSLRGVLDALPAQVRYVWRHLPLTDVHPAAWRAALASEAAARQGAFWPMHDALLDSRDALDKVDLVELARELGLNENQFIADLEGLHSAQRVAADVESARLSGVAGTPTLFVNGTRHEGAYDTATLVRAVRVAAARGRPNRAQAVRALGK